MSRDSNMGLGALIVALFGLLVLAPLGLNPRGGPSGPSTAASPAGVGAMAGRAGGAEAEPRLLQEPHQRVLEPLRAYLGVDETKTPTCLHREFHERFAFQFMMVCIPDPVDSAQGHRFDLLLDAFQNALKTDGLEIDRHYLPWHEYQLRVSRRPESRFEPGLRLYEREPGLLIFRDNRPIQDGRPPRLLLAFLVGETPVFGIHKQAFHESVKLIEQLSANQELTLPVLGPFFSGSVDSLAMSITQARSSNSQRTFRVISGSATNIDPGDFRKRTRVNGLEDITFQTVQASSKVMRDALIDYVTDRIIASDVTIAWLTEANTGYGGYADPGIEPYPKNGRRVTIIEFPFPLNISRFRMAYEGERSAAENADQLTQAIRRRRLKIPLDDLDTARDVPPHATPLVTAVAIESMLSEILETIDREGITYVGITSSDTRDRIFLASLIRHYRPNVQLMTILSDLLFTHPDYNIYLKGMLVGSAYPLYTKDQLWCDPFGGMRDRIVQFASAGHQGFYNAALALRQETSSPEERDKYPPLQLLGYAKPFDQGSSARPAVWISVVGNYGFWPLRYREVEGPDASGMYVDSAGVKARATSRGTNPEVNRAGPLEGLGESMTVYDGHSLTLMIALLLFGAVNVLVYFRGSGWGPAKCLARPDRPAGGDDPKPGNRVLYLGVCAVSIWAVLVKQGLMTSIPIITDYSFIYINNYLFLNIYKLILLGLSSAALVGAVSYCLGHVVSNPSRLGAFRRGRLFLVAGVLAVALIVLGRFALSPGLWPDYLIFATSLLVGGGLLAVLLDLVLRPPQDRTPELVAAGSVAQCALVMMILSSYLIFRRPIVLVGVALVLVAVLGAREIRARWPGWSSRRGFIGTLLILFMILILILLIYVFATNPINEPLGHAVLWFERTSRVFSGVSLFVPVTLLASAFYVWGYCQLRRVDLHARHRMEAPWPTPDPATPPDQRTMLNRLQENDREIVMLVESPCQALRSKAPGLFLAAAALAGLWTLRLLFNSLPPFERQELSILLWGGLIVFLFLWLHWWLELIFVMRSLWSLLKTLANLPLQWSFTQLPEPIAALTGRLLEGQRPRLSHHKVAAQFAEQIKNNFCSNLGDSWTGVRERNWGKHTHVFDQVDPAREDEREFEAVIKPEILKSSRLLWGELGRVWSRRPVREVPESPREVKEAAGGTVVVDEVETAPTLSNRHHVQMINNAKTKWVRLAEDFLAIQIVIYLSQFFIQARSLLLGLGVGSLLMLFTVLSYPLHPHRLLVASCTAMVVAVAVTAVVIFVRMEYDPLVSRITKEGSPRIKFDIQFLGHVLLYVVPVVLILLARAFPEMWSWVGSVLDPMLRRAA